MPLCRYPCALILLAAACPVGAQSVPQGDIQVRLDPIATGLTAPVWGTHAGDGSGRLFVVDQAGQIRIVEDGILLATPFLDLTSEIVAVDPNFDERGVLGLAFHPEYTDNGRFFVRYSRPRDGVEGEPCFGTSRGCHDEVLAEFSVSADPDIANPDGTILYVAPQPQFNHDAGSVAFGPDGLLYFSLGDGGGAHDGLASDPPLHGPTGHGQNIETDLGSMLRIDINSSGAGTPGYGIPADNPFAETAGVDEIYAYGLRNPYRFSFDDGPGGDGRLILADVGQNRFEEINIIENGGNYGWVIREGFHCFDPMNPLEPPAECDATGPFGEPLVDPVAEYDHEDGLAVIGGFVYRGTDFAALSGKYVFGDFSLGFGPGSGTVFYLDADGDMSQIFKFLTPGGNPLTEFVFGFGEDEDGELYMMTSSNLGPTGSTGNVYHITHCVADFNTDGQVNSDDFFAFLAAFDAGNADVNGDGATNSADFFAFLEAFDAGC